MQGYPATQAAIEEAPLGWGCGRGCVNIQVWVSIGATIPLELQSQRRLNYNLANSKCTVCSNGGHHMVKRSPRRGIKSWQRQSLCGSSTPHNHLAQLSLRSVPAFPSKGGDVTGGRQGKVISSSTLGERHQSQMTPLVHNPWTLRVY